MRSFQDVGPVAVQSVHCPKCNKCIYFIRSRSKIASHPGFEERLCYGDIVLAFEHVSHPFSARERKHIEKVREENEATLEKQLREQPVQPQKRWAARYSFPLRFLLSRIKSRAFVKSQTVLSRCKLIYRILEEGKHDFIGTHFQSATYCNFCCKKVLHCFLVRHLPCCCELELHMSGVHLQRSGSMNLLALFDRFGSKLPSSAGRAA